MTEALTSRRWSARADVVPKNLYFTTMTQYDKSLHRAVRAGERTAR